MITNSLANLQQALVESYNLNELQDLCFTLSVNYQSLPGDNTLENKMQELITYLSRRGRLLELVSVCRHQRPNVQWDDLISTADQSHISVFISHVSQDREIADIISQTLNRITLRQLTISSSIDIISSNGMVPVSDWLTEIRQQLSHSRIVIPLLTTNSLETSWIYFESGFGAASSNCDLLPLTVNLDCSNDIPLPLAMYRCYQLSDYASFKSFIQRVLNTFNINFDEEMAKSILENTIETINKIALQSQPANEAKENKGNILFVLEEFKEHIDRRLLALTKKQSEEASYSINIDVNFPDLKKILLFDVLPETTEIQDILNRIYFELEDKVEPFTYMHDWVLREKNTDTLLIINREFAEQIPAKYIFQRFSHFTEWEAIRLSKPLLASKPTIRFEL